MSSQSPGSFSDDRCVKCSVVVVLEARVTELEARIRCLEELKSSYSSVLARGLPDRAAGRSISISSSSKAELSPSASPVQPGLDQEQNRDHFVTVRRGQGAKRRTSERRELHVYNRFSPLSDHTPAEHTRETLVIGSSIVRDVKLPAASVRSYPGARMGDIEGNLRLLKQSRDRFRRVVIHAGGNDAQRRQSEVLRVQVAAVCELAKSMSDTVIFSGPLPNRINAELYSRLSAFNSWLSRWFPQNNVVFIDNWSAFWGKPGLIRRDGIHPTSEGTSLLVRNLTDSLSRVK
ncbi:uncharacterized protein [Eucyclogobius newberryi]|uniref:uncharacterized protein n=1 Tax=Eucyclogobius newberryi TaxID=166745 RepID=UPI003B5B2FCF